MKEKRPGVYIQIRLGKQASAELAYLSLITDRWKTPIVEELLTKAIAIEYNKLTKETE